jgi:catechol 2,3-dioxygenase-like lactoylglutathione lyase family enzyme
MDLESVQIGVHDLEQATADYVRLLGSDPVASGGVRRFPLARGAVELETGEGGVRSLRFYGEASAGVDFHGLRVHVVPHPGTGSPPPATDVAIDHVVVRTPNPERAIALWRDRLGLRLALDRAFPERGLRLLFFRSGGLTFEFAASEPPPAERDGADVLYGISYRVPDLERRRERLLAAGVDVSPIRPGMRPGTSVATVRSATAGVPTLLLQAHG